LIRIVLFVDKSIPKIHIYLPEVDLVCVEFENTNHDTIVSPFMKKIALLGAGRSSSSLIRYLAERTHSEDFSITIADQIIGHFPEIVNSNERVEEIVFDVFDDESRKKLVWESDLVISMLPAHLHIHVAQECVDFKKNMITASYVSKEMKALHDQAVEAGVMLLNEMGVDPGIDHMSAMRIIDQLRNKGAHFLQFESFTGGLVAPESDDNPWGYKFTWNPRNVVLAGQGGAVKFIQEGLYKFIPYHMLFRRTEMMEVEGYGKFEGYANRDSLSYRSLYNLNDIRTMYRGTLRRPGFCKAWDVFVKLGATDDSYILEDSETLTHRGFINKFLAFNLHDSVELKLMHYLKIDQDSDIMEKLEWLGIFTDEVVGLKNATPAQVLQHILLKKWSLKPHDKDMIVMVHKFGFELDGKKQLIESSMVSVGEDQTYTAMAKTVGLPVAIGALLMLKGEIHKPGVHLPITPEIYNPILDELEKFDITFKEKAGEYVGYQ
jgi:saccharopine dehydrogenase-like NADP-dependent oxidoreductase